MAHINKMTVVGDPSWENKMLFLLGGPPLIFVRLTLCEGIDQKFEIPADRIKNGAGASTLRVFSYLGACFCGCARGCDLVNQLIRNEMLGFVDLFLCGRPS